MLTCYSSPLRLISRLQLPRISACFRFATLHTTCRNPLNRRISTYDDARTVSDHTPASKISCATYSFHEDLEPFERYAAGGYYPVQIGDHFCSSRYCIVHKLGYGASSTTWLARDKLLAKYVAIKFVVSELGLPPESAILKSLQDGEGAQAGIAMMQELLDEFEVEGPEILGLRKQHHCLVTTPARMSIAEARDASCCRLFQPLVARAIAAQLIEAVAFVHSRGIIHADLHEANILFSLPSSIDNFDVGLLYEKYGQPELEHILRSDEQPLDPWIPTHGVVPAWLGCASDEITLADSRIFLIDFGESCRPPVDMRKSNTPFIYRAPEILLDPTAHVSFLAEIWSLACALFAIMGQRHLFETWLPTRDQIIEEHVDMLGHLPGEWQTSWAIHSQCFDDQLRRVDGEPRRPLEDRFEYSIQEPRREAGMLEMDNKEKEAFLDLLRSMLAVRPDCRPSAQHIVESRWVQKYAKPALELAKDSQQTCVQSAD